MQHDKMEHSREGHDREEHGRKRIMKPLAEMNLLDNILFTQMVTSPQYGERFAKILVQTLTQKDISKFICRPQNVYPGANSDLHATRMDVIIEEEESGKRRQFGFAGNRPDGELYQARRKSGGSVHEII